MHYLANWIFPIAGIRQRHLCLYALCLVMSFSTAGAEPAASYNHFQTTENHSQSPKQAQKIDPLTAYPAAHYVVHGVIVMEDNAVAVVYSPRDTWHRLQVHSHLGQEQAIIRQITTRGIQIDMQDTLLWLPVLQ